MCPDHPRTELMGFPKAEPGQLYCRKCERARVVRDGAPVARVRFAVDPGVSLCPRCWECSTNCVRCGRRTCPGHARLSGPEERLCVECADALARTTPASPVPATERAN